MPEKKENKKEIKPGYLVKVHQKIKEAGKERVQVFEGVVLALRGKEKSKTFTVRKISEGVGVEKIFPLYSPTIKKIDIVKKQKVRKAKLYYLRSSKAKKLREKK